MRTLCLLVAAPLVLAAGAVDSPSSGYARTADGTILRVSGIGGAFITTTTDQTGSIAAAFSERLGLVKLATAIRVLDPAGAVVSESDAPEGDALLGFSKKGDSAIVYYASTQTISIFTSGQWVPVPFDVASTSVLAVAVQDSDTALVLVLRDQLSLVTLRTSDGAVIDENVIGSGIGPALLLPDRRIIFVRDRTLLYRDPAGVEQVLQALPADVTALSRMDSEWVHARTESGRNLAFRLDSERRLYELPGVPQ